MTLEIPFSERARKWGYLYWTKEQDDRVVPYLKDISKYNRVDIWFQDSHLGLKNIDYEHRRISLGYKVTRPLPDKISKFLVSSDKKGVIRIQCK